jgi:hypothetical protein
LVVKMSHATVDCRARQNGIISWHRPMSELGYAVGAHRNKQVMRFGVVIALLSWSQGTYDGRPDTPYRLERPLRTPILLFQYTTDDPSPRPPATTFYPLEAVALATCLEATAAAYAPTDTASASD